MLRLSTIKIETDVCNPIKVPIFNNYNVLDEQMDIGDSKTKTMGT